MRIDRIAIRGLSSLRDPQPVIDLTDPAFAPAGLIAVTGPTGAGKSTIFDAICLPLYDATPRLSGRGADPRELLSRGAASARVELTLRQLVAAFEKSNLAEISPVGEKFDPHRHQAISQLEADGQPNTVLSVLQKGYALHGRVIRPALVVVSKAKAAPAA